MVVVGVIVGVGVVGVEVGVVVGVGVGGGYENDDSGGEKKDRPSTNYTQNSRFLKKSHI